MGPHEGREDARVGLDPCPTPALRLCGPGLAAGALSTCESAAGVAPRGWGAPGLGHGQQANGPPGGVAAVSGPVHWPPAG